MAYLTLTEAKKHLVLDADWTDDDLYVTGLIDMVAVIVANDIHEDLTDLEVDGDLPSPLIHAMKLLIGHFYENREPLVVGTMVASVPYTLQFLLDPYRNRTIA